MRSFWFGPKSPFDLAVCRIAWFGFLFFFYLAVDFSSWANMDLAFWKPISFFESLGITPPPASVLLVLQVTWKLSLLLCCLGLFSRFSTLVAFAIGLYLLGLPHNFGKVHHFDAVVVLTMGILACSRCGDALSLDAWWRRKAGGWSTSGEYRWPIRCVWMLLSLIFFAAGTSKLVHSGLAWMDPVNLRIKLISHHYYYGGIPPTDWGLYIAQLPSLTALMAIGTIIIECGLFLAMFHWGFRLLLVPSAIAMLVSIPLIQGPFFLQLIMAFLFWVPWEELWNRLRKAEMQ